MIPTPACLPPQSFPGSKGYAKLSSLGLAITAKDLRGRRATLSVRTNPAPPAQPHASVFAMDAVDMARVMADWGLAEKEELHRAVQEAVAAREARLGHAPAQLRLAHMLRTATGLTPAGQKTSRRGSRSHGRLRPAGSKTSR